MVEISPNARTAFAMLHADLNATGIVDYQFHLVDTGGTAQTNYGPHADTTTNGFVADEDAKVYAAALPDGSFDVSNGRWVDYDHLTETKDLLLAVAGSAQDALFEIQRVIWPRCREHQSRLVTPSQGRPRRTDGRCGGVTPTADTSWLR